MGSIPVNRRYPKGFEESRVQGFEGNAKELQSVEGAAKVIRTQRSSAQLLQQDWRRNKNFQVTNTLNGCGYYGFRYLLGCSLVTKVMRSFPSDCREGAVFA